MDFERLSRADLASAFGVTPKTITRWYRQGLPRHADGTYSLPEAISWTVDRAKCGVEAESDESKRWLAEFRKERAKISRIEREKLEGSLLSRDEIAELWAWRITEIKSGLLNLQHRLPPLLEGKNQVEMAQAISSEVLVLCGQYYRGHRFCPEAVTKRVLEIIKKEFCNQKEDKDA